MTTLRYLNGYPTELIARVQQLSDRGQLATWVEKKYPGQHSIQDDKSLYQYVGGLKQRYLKNAPALSKVMFDNKQNPVKGSLGTNIFVSHVLGGNLKLNNEIRIHTLLRVGPDAFRKMTALTAVAPLKAR